MVEPSLILDCINNNPTAQRELYNRFSGLFYAICCRYAYDSSEAEDMLQEGFIKIFTQLDKFENRGSFEGWMRKTIVNTCLNYIKKNKQFKENLDADLAINFEVKEESLASKILGKQVMHYLLQMPYLYRVIINLYAIEGYSYKEIATMLNLEESTCRSRYMRGKDMLENILIQKGIIPNSSENKEWLNILHS